MVSDHRFTEHSIQITELETLYSVTRIRLGSEDNGNLTKEFIQSLYE